MSKIQTLSFWFLCGLLWQILSSLTVKTFGFEYPLYVSLILREMDWLVIRRQIWSFGAGDYYFIELKYAKPGVWLQFISQV